MANPQKKARNSEIYARYKKGETPTELAKFYNIRRERVHAIIKFVDELSTAIAKNT